MVRMVAAVCIAALAVGLVASNPLTVSLAIGGLIPCAAVLLPVRRRRTRR